MKSTFLISICSVIIASSAVLAQNSQAETSHTEKMCAKIKECVLSDASSEQIPEEMRGVVVQMLDTQCQTLAARYDQQFEQAGLQDQAEACVDSIVEQSCEVLMSSQSASETEQCKEFEKAANEAGIDLEAEAQQ